MKEYVNKLFNMDNLELMKQLPTNSIDLIYCDILYATGKKFTDYQDLKANKNIVNEFYIPRLIEMKRILKNSGSIYLQMDYRINHWIRFILDDIFGYENFRNEIIWKRQPPRGARKSSHQYPRILDNILYYSKSDNYTYNQQFKDYSDKMMKRYKKDENGRMFRLDTLGDYSQDSIIKFEELGRIYVTKNNKKQLIRYLDEELGEPVSELWDDIFNVNPMSNERVGYDTQKPKSLLERVIKTSSNEGDLVADFFCGSGTACVVAKELERNYIGCDISEKAINITNNRINNI